MVCTIKADVVRAMFPKLIGDVRGGFRFDRETVLVDMGPKAVAVMVGSDMRACCPSEKHARAFAAKAAAARTRPAIVVPQIGPPKL